MTVQIVEISYPIQLQSSSPLSLAIGFFDGVHLGHQGVINRAIQLSKQLQTVPAVMTFDPHPKEVVSNQKMEQFLTPMHEKIKQFSKLGIEKTLIMRFDTQLAALSKEAFVEEILLPLQVQSVSTGYNFTFGKGASGCSQDMKELGRGYFTAHTVEPIQTEQGIPSSSRIRQALFEGQIETANQLLGRSYQIKGKVIQGDQRGRLLGFPTANLQLEHPYLIPRRGVYIVQVLAQNQPFFGLMNIGFRPTFRNPEPKLHLEVHLLDQSIDLYGQQLTIDFLQYIREERRFPSAEELRNQIQLDRTEAYRWLESYSLQF